MTYSDEEILRRLRLGEDSAWAFKQVEFSGDQPTSPRSDDWANERRRLRQRRRRRAAIVKRLCSSDHQRVVHRDRSMGRGSGCQITNLEDRVEILVSRRFRAWRYRQSTRNDHSGTALGRHGPPEIVRGAGRTPVRRGRHTHPLASFGTASSCRPRHRNCASYYRPMPASRYVDADLNKTNRRVRMRQGPNEEESGV